MVIRRVEYLARSRLSIPANEGRRARADLRCLPRRRAGWLCMKAAMEIALCPRRARYLRHQRPTGCAALLPTGDRPTGRALAGCTRLPGDGSAPVRPGASGDEPSAKTGSCRSWAAMGPAKAAMEALLRYLAWDLAGRGITANAVSPGATDDSVFSTLPPEVLEALRGWAGAGWVPMGRLTTPADVGDAVALLCSEQAGFITGQTLHEDGGASLASADFPMEFQRGT